MLLSSREKRGNLVSAFIGTVLLSLAAMPVQAENFLWKVQGARNTVYLLGSMHLLPAKAYPLPDVIEQSYRNCEIVAFETDIGAAGNEETQMALLNAGMYPDGENLMNALHTSVLAPYAEAVQELRLPVSMINRYRPWLAALTIEMSVYAKHQFKAELGVDRHFYQKAVVAEKRIISLESIEEQSKLFTNMSHAMAQDYLALTLYNLDEIDYDPRELYEIWADGDDGDMEDFIDPVQDDYPELYKLFIKNRNQKWLPKILELLKGDKDAFVVVGALHIPGDHGLLQLLENAGYDPDQM